MATASHYIRSEYDPELDKDRLLRETGQPPDGDVDPWQTESSSAGFHSSRRLANAAPKFVPALLPYDEWGSTAATSARSEPTSNSYGDVASWYRSLSRRGASPTQQEQQAQAQQQQQPQPPSQTDATSHRSPEATPEPSTSSSLTPSITHPASSSSPAYYPATTLSSSAWPAPPRRQHRAGRDWFIARALSESESASASAPPTPRSNNTNTSGSSSSLADILSRHPPSAQPLQPPVFLHLGPSNKGWAMLQNQGWSEGEGLGASSILSSSKQPTTSLGGNDDAPNKTKKDKTRKRTRLVRPSQPLQEEQATEEQEQEVVLLDNDDDDDDPIIEVQKKVHVPIIDLTQSDAEEDEDEEDGEEDDDSTNDNDSSLAPATNSDPRAAQTALLTPLPTVLKSDRLGIGLKAKTEGKYRSSVKRVTHNAAALAAHIKTAEDLRRAQRQLGRGRRAFARAERTERERRQNMMAYLSEP